MIGLELRWSLDFFSLGVLRVLLLFTFIKVFVDWLVLELLSWLRLVWIRLSDAWLTDALLNFFVVDEGYKLEEVDFAENILKDKP
jgi:hypothetical protein